MGFPTCTPALVGLLCSGPVYVRVIDRWLSPAVPTAVLAGQDQVGRGLSALVADVAGVRSAVERCEARVPVGCPSPSPPVPLTCPTCPLAPSAVPAGPAWGGFWWLAVCASAVLGWAGGLYCGAGCCRRRLEALPLVGVAAEPVGDGDYHKTMVASSMRQTRRTTWEPMYVVYNECILIHFRNNERGRFFLPRSG